MEDNYDKITITPLGRILKHGGAERVSESAKEELAKYLEEQAAAITEIALESAKANGRKTLKSEDIIYAYKIL